MVDSVGPGGREMISIPAEPQEVTHETTEPVEEAPKKRTRKKKTSE